MSLASVGEIRVETFVAQMKQQGDALVVGMRGNGDTAVLEQLKLFLDELLATAKSARVQEVTFEIQDLYFMNSSCLSLLLRFLNGSLEQRPPQRFRVRFRSNPNLRWQKKSLEAMRAYAMDIVVIE
jgi:hypothetical protein